jgi:UDP-N-acetylmuramyl pentapeptide phosphotransferase/UDP-N-acetylglucosamine-1-phosphate transferase
MRFVTLYGALFFGSLTLALSMALLFAANDAYFFAIVRSHLIWLASSCVLSGALLGFLWYEFNEYRYRRSFPNGDGSGGL